MISGFCIGGGCEIAIACDFRFADTTSKFGITPARLGLVYSLAATKSLVDLVGPANAKVFLMSGELLDGAAKSPIGLITELCDPELLRDRTYEFARILASRAPLTVRAAKSIVGMILRWSGCRDGRSLWLCRTWPMHRTIIAKGVAAFLEGRIPHFALELWLCDHTVVAADSLYLNRRASLSLGDLRSEHMKCWFYLTQD